jgi:predicted DCC family thiol-disulfide oxidoreductase YuxK
MDDRRPALVYDGRCRFCVDQATRLAGWLGGRVRLESFRDPGVVASHPGLTEAACDQALHLIEADGTIHRGADAVARALRLRPALAPVGWLYYLPGVRQLADAAYAVVARNRFRLRGDACSDDACRLHESR